MAVFTRRLFLQVASTVLLAPKKRRPTTGFGASFGTSFGS